MSNTHDLRALTHFQHHLAFHHHKFPYPRHPLSNLPLRTRRLYLLFPSLENVKMQKHLSIPVFYISTNDLQNLEQSRTKSHGFSPICKPVRLMPGTNMLWHKFSKRCSGTTLQMRSYRKYNTDLATPINEQQCS